MSRILIAILFVFSTAISLSADEYKILPALCSLTFEGNAQAHGVHGEGRAFSGTITGNPEDITTAKIIVTLDPSTFNTRNKKRDEVMREKSLELDKFPSITFESTSIEATKKQLLPDQPLDATIHGKLKLHGIEQEVKVPVKIVMTEKNLTAEGSMTLSLDQYKVFRPRVLFFRLQDELKLHFKVGAARADSLSPQ